MARSSEIFRRRGSPSRTARSSRAASRLIRARRLPQRIERRQRGFRAGLGLVRSNCNELSCILRGRKGGETMYADRVEVSWDAGKSKWLVRIQTGEEVIRRHSNLAKNVDEQTLRSAAQKTLAGEGYEAGAPQVSIQR